MQYYNNYIKSKNDHFESITVCLNQAVTLCTERAKMLYSCEITLDCPEKPMYIEKNFAETAGEIALVLEKVKNVYSPVKATLSITDDGKYAIFSVYAENENIYCEKAFELYTGTPDYVVSDSDSDCSFEKTVEDIFNLLEKC